MKAHALGGGRSRLDPDLDDNILLPEDEQRRLARTRSRQELARAQVLQNLMIGVTLCSLLVTALSVFFWRRAEADYDENVRVAFVKVLPNGATQVEYYDDGGENNRWFQATINKSLIDYVEHRYQKKHATITYDWGFAMQFMGDSPRAAFTNEFKAAEKAAAFENCASCPETNVFVRATDHDEIVMPDEENEGLRVVNSTVYLRETETGSDGRTISDANKILRLVWTFRPKAELTPDMLRANPLGMAILQERMTNDLTQPMPAGN